HHDLVPSGERIVEFERAILDQLRIEAPIGAEIDVLEENAEHRWRNRRTRVGGIDRDHGRVSLLLARKPDGKEGKQKHSERDLFTLRRPMIKPSSEHVYRW